MTEFQFSSQFDSSGESSQSTADSSEQGPCKLKAAVRTTSSRRCTSRGRKRLQGQCHRSYSPEEEEDKKRRRAKKERTRVSNLAAAYQSLARTLGLYPLRGSQKRITHEQILQGANNLIGQLKKEVDCLRGHTPTHNKVVPDSDYENPSYTPSKHYTISSSGQVVVVEEAESISGQLDCLNRLDLSCDETLPLPTLEESEESSDISMDVQTTLQTSPAPVLSYELLSPQSSANEFNNFHQLLSASLMGESLVSSSSMTSLPNLRHSLLIGSPPLMSLCAHIPAPSCSGQAYVSPPIDIVACEEIVNEDSITSKNTPVNGSKAT